MGWEGWGGKEERKDEFRVRMNEIGWCTCVGGALILFLFVAWKGPCDDTVESREGGGLFKSGVVLEGEEYYVCIHSSHNTPHIKREPAPFRFAKGRVRHRKST